MIKLILASLLLFSVTAGATSITVDGNEWRQPVDFVGQSWSAIAGVCDPLTGACNGSLNGDDLTGWTWASQSDVNELFGNYFSFPSSDPNIVAGLPAAAMAFFGDGWLPTYEGPGITTIATAGWMSTGPESHGTLAFSNELGLSIARTDFFWDIELGPSNWGGWFRRAEVPTPPTPVLMILSLLMLFGSRKPAVAIGYTNNLRSAAQNS